MLLSSRVIYCKFIFYFKMSEGAEIKISTKPKKVAGTARKRVGTAGVGKVVAAEGGATTKQLSVDATPLDPASVDATTAPVDTPVGTILYFKIIN